MGKSKNVFKQIGEVGTDFTSKTFGNIARTVGADGLADFVDKQTKSGQKVTGGLVDKLSGRQGRLEQNAKDEASKQAGIASAAAKQRQVAADKAANDVVESNRMNVGSQSRTLLTGGTGLEDDENLSVSRRTLVGN